jgi:cytochrome b561
MQWTNSAERYGAISRTLHWLVVALIITQVVLGKIAEDMPIGVEKLATLSQHKSIGMLVLVLALARIGWRLFSPGPRAPSESPAWQRAAAGASHGLLYVLLVLQPVTGWLMSSTKNYPVSFFGWFQFPDLVGASEVWHERLEESHEFLAGTIIAIAVLHAAAALYHHFVLRDGVLRRMLPGLGRS